MIAVQRDNHWFGREGQLLYALTRSPHVKTLHLPCPHRRCGYAIMKLPMTHMENVYIQVPLTSRALDASLVRCVMSLPEDRQATFRFPVPGPWVDRPYLSLNEVDKMYVYFASMD
jgi:hypothetical protein